MPPPCGKLAVSLASPCAGAKLHRFFPERVQLRSGVILSLGALLLHQRHLPYKSNLCNTIQAAAQLQVVFTYLTASLFFVDDLSELSESDSLTDEW